MGLGHWSWIRLTGKGHQITQIVALYRPCPSDGPLSTYQQHCRGLAKLNRNDCPQDAILHDLASEVLLWQEAGNVIIVLMDFNEDLWLPWIQNFFANLNLIEALTELMDLPPTVTHNRGTTTIDGIYVSPYLLPSITGGYLAFDAGIPSNHRALWIDMPGTIFGFDEEPKLRKSNARHLQCRDPRVVTKYVQHLSQTLEQTNAFQQLNNLRPVLQQTRMT